MRKFNSLPFAKRAAVLVFLTIFAVTSAVYAQTNVVKQGGEYAIVGALAGDQTHCRLAFGPEGGWIVWQDNAIDGTGFGIGARRLDSNISGDLGVFPVNSISQGDQTRPCVALLKNGGAAFAWQGGRIGFEKIYTRFLNSAGVFVT